MNWQGKNAQGLPLASPLGTRVLLLTYKAGGFGFLDEFGAGRSIGIVLFISFLFPFILIQQ
jgi:hypothetical protein